MDFVEIRLGLCYLSAPRFSCSSGDRRDVCGKADSLLYEPAHTSDNSDSFGVTRRVMAYAVNAVIKFLKSLG